MPPKSARSREKSHLLRIEGRRTACAVICKGLICETLEYVVRARKGNVPLPFGADLSLDRLGQCILLSLGKLGRLSERFFQRLGHGRFPHSDFDFILLYSGPNFQAFPPAGTIALIGCGECRRASGPLQCEGHASLGTPALPELPGLGALPPAVVQPAHRTSRLSSLQHLAIDDDQHVACDPE